MLHLGGVPTEERFRKLTEAQWSLIVHKYMQMKVEKYDNELSIIEYLAQMVSPAGPQAIQKIASSRRKNMEKIRKEEDGEKDDNVLVENETQVVKRYSIEGEIVNTSFEDAIREVMGNSEQTDETLKAILGDDHSKSVVYTVDKGNLQYLKNSEDLKAKMEKIVQQGNQKPLEEQVGQLNQEELDALKALEFDTISF